MTDVDKADTNESADQPDKRVTDRRDIDQGRLYKLAKTLRKYFLVAFNTGLAIAGLLIGIIGLHLQLRWPLIIGGAVMVVTGLTINWLWGRRDVVRIGVAISSALVIAAGGAAIAAAIAVAHHHTTFIYVTKTNYLNSPTVTIDQPEPGSWITPKPDVSGALSGIAPDQYVWDLNQPFNLGNPQTTGDLLYPVERCSISADRSSFSCTDVFTGDEAHDYCRMILMWITVVSSSRNAALEKQTAHGNEISSSISWPSQPPHIGNGVAEVEVQRNPLPGKTCPSGL
jgi:hypothetical protein